MRHFDLENVPNGGGQGKGDWATQGRGRAGAGLMARRAVSSERALMGSPRHVEGAGRGAGSEVGPRGMVARPSSPKIDGGPIVVR